MNFIFTLDSLIKYLTSYQTKMNIENKKVLINNKYVFIYTKSIKCNQPIVYKINTLTYCVEIFF
jgi:hypothetical protein